LAVLFPTALPMLLFEKVNAIKNSDDKVLKKYLIIGRSVGRTNKSAKIQ